MNFNPMAFIENLKYMFVGMVGIFLVILVIILVTVIINNIFTKNEKKD